MLKKIVCTKAFSLIELMISIALLVIIGLTITSLFLNAQKTFNHTESRIRARQETSVILRTMEKELRQISKASEDFDSIELADKNNLIFYADIDNDNKPEKISYQLDGQKIIKETTQTSNNAAPWEFNGANTQETLTNYSQNNSINPLFTFYSEIDQPLTNLPLNKADRESIKIIKINIRLSFPKSVKEESLETEVYLRNKNDPL